jgi:AmmeMemoRadiSam system protein A
MQISEEIKGVLLMAARDAIRSLFGESHPLIIDYSFYPQLLDKNAGVFVTLTQNHELRGCIGYLENSGMTLYDAICEAAKHAAINDPRFYPVNQQEVPDLNIEISILSSSTPIEDYSEIQVGVHGLLLKEGNKQGLLLPQVATENSFTLQQFLTAICQKAGVDSYLWQTKMLNIKIFTAAVFSEAGKREKTYEPG